LTILANQATLYITSFIFGEGFLMMYKDVLSKEELAVLMDHKNAAGSSEEDKQAGQQLLETLGSLSNEHSIAVVLETLVQRLIRRTDSLEKQLTQSQQAHHQLEKKVQKLESQLYRLERLDLLQQQLEGIAAAHRETLIEQKAARDRGQYTESVDSKMPNPAASSAFYDHDTSFFEAVDRLFDKPKPTNKQAALAQNLARDEAAASKEMGLDAAGKKTAGPDNDLSRTDRPKRKSILDKWF
jgi:hypothetical protein